MKWRKFIWSATLWIVLLLGIWWLHAYRGVASGKFGLAPLFLIVWLICTLFALISVIVRKVRRQRGIGSFFYIWLGQGNLILAYYGFSQVFLSFPGLAQTLAILMFSGNLVLAFLIGSDYFF
jgi:hypothetical protein